MLAEIKCAFMMNKPVFEGEILLCEDNSMNQELVFERLTKLGLKTIIAENGKEGLEKVKNRIHNGRKPFDLIFMDIYMPMMDGLEAAMEIGKLNTGSPIIALTANSTPADREQYAAHGMYDCLNKPFTLQELLDCLVKYLTPVQVNLGSPPDEEKLKNKLVHIFIRNNKNFYNEITKVIENGDIKQAHLLAHSLKGNAGLLGKMRLRKAAEDIENLLIHEENQVNEFAMNTLKTELDTVLEDLALLANELAAGQSDAETNKVVTDLDDEKVRALFDELETLIDGGDVQCLNLIDRLRPIPGTDELIQQLEYFEFDMAMKTLVLLKNNISK